MSSTTPGTPTDSTVLALLQLSAVGDHYVVRLKGTDPDAGTNFEHELQDVPFEAVNALMTVMISLMRSLIGINQSSRP